MRRIAMGLGIGFLTTFPIFARPYLPQVSLLKNTKTAVVIKAARYDLTLVLAPKPLMTLRLVLQSQTELEIGHFPLEGATDVMLDRRTVRDPSSTLVGKTIKRDLNGYDLVVDYRSSLWEEKEIIIRAFPSFFTYDMRLRASSPEEELQTVYYLARSGTKGNVVQYGRGEFDEVFTWTPDLYDALIPHQRMLDIDLSSTSLTGRWTPGSYLRGYRAGSGIVPPYVAALRTRTGWWGIGTLAIPATRDGLRLLVTRHSLTSSFDFGAVSRVGNKEVETPPVGFFFGKRPLAILSAYEQVLDLARLPKLAPSAPWQSWWSGPIYCTVGDQVYKTRLSEGTLREANDWRALTPQNVEKWLAIARDKQLPFNVLVLDWGWNRSFRFHELRDLINHLHASGLHVLLWISMYSGDGPFFSLDRFGFRAVILRQHPAWLVQTRTGHVTPAFDYTNPEVRAYVRGRISFLLGSQSNDLNADGLKIDFPDYVPDPATSVFHDPGWGTGELMNYKVMRLIYRAAKKAKSDALVESSFMNPLFSNVQDVMRLNDDVSNCRSTYWWRAWAATVSGVRAIDGDDWWAMASYFVPLTLAKAAWGIPTLYALQYRGVLGSAGAIMGIKVVASGGFPVNISSQDYRRVSAILHVYMHAPADPATQTAHVDPKAAIAYRKYREGLLKGFFASTTLNFAHVLVAYAPQSAWLMSTADLRVHVPTPPGSTVQSVLEVDWNGTSRSVPFRRGARSIEFYARDSGARAEFYILKFVQLSAAA